MKKLIKFLGLAAIIAGMLTACSNNEPSADKEYLDWVKDGKIVHGTIAPAAMTVLKGGSATIKFVFSNKYDYTVTGDLLLSPVPADDEPFRNDVIIENGKSWTPMLSSTKAGLTEFSKVITKIGLIRKMEYKVYIKHDLVFDEDSRKLTLEGPDGNNYQLLNATDKYMSVSVDIPYYDSNHNITGRETKIALYEICATTPFGGDIYGFDSRESAYDWLIELYSSVYGNLAEQPVVDALISERDNPAEY